MASDIETYLKELQAALAGADPALVQDALFDAEEHLQSEVASGRPFAEVVEHYGTPQEVAAAYLGSGTGASPGRGGAGQPQTTAVPPVPPGAPVDTQGYGQQPWAPGGPGAPGAVPPYPYYAEPVRPQPSVWKEIFGVFADPHVWKSMVYMLISLGTGIAYFTVIVTMLSLSLGMSVLIIGAPLLLLTLALVRGMALFEGRLVEVLLGTRMPRRPRSEFPGSFFQRLWFWLKDGRTWASLAYLLLMLPIGIVYFTLTVTFLAVGLGLIFGPIVAAISGQTWIDWTAGPGWEGWLPPGWSVPLFVIAGFLVLLGWFHAARWIGYGHASFAKAMLVRLAR